MPGSFDTAHHQYSVAFVLQGGKVPLKEPIIADDSSDSGLSVLVPPFLLGKGTHGRADLHIVTDGNMDDACAARVRIAKLPKSASKVPGLVTLSWLRAHQSLYSQARPTLTSAEAGRFLSPAVVANIDMAATNASSLIPNFDLKGKKSPLTKTARQSDSLITGILTAGQTVGDASYASACANLLHALSAAQSSSDQALQAAEFSYAQTVLTLTGASALTVAKFHVGCTGVTTTGVAASATLLSSHASSGTIDAQSTGNAVCGAAVSSSTIITGVTTLINGATTASSSQTMYGKTLLRGSAGVASSTITSYGPLPPQPKLCGCPTPIQQTTISSSITVITITQQLTQMSTQVCLPDVTSPLAPGVTASCGNGVVDMGEECDPAATPTGCGSGKTCQACRCVGTGDVQVTLTWSTVDDLDLHVIEPSGEEIYYGHRTSATGGALDVDSNAGCSNPQTNPVENIFWAAGTAPRGTYTVEVDYFRHCTSAAPTVPFAVETLVDGRQTIFDGTVTTPDACGACGSCGTCTMITTFTR